MTRTHAWRVPISHSARQYARRIACWMPIRRYHDVLDFTACGKVVNVATAEPKRAVNRFCARCRKAKESA